MSVVIFFFHAAKLAKTVPNPIWSTLTGIKMTLTYYFILYNRLYFVSNHNTIT